MAPKTTASLCFSRLIKCESYQILIFHDTQQYRYDSTVHVCMYV